MGVDYVAVILMLIKLIKHYKVVVLVTYIYNISVLHSVIGITPIVLHAQTEQSYSRYCRYYIFNSKDLRTMP